MTHSVRQIIGCLVLFAGHAVAQSATAQPSPDQLLKANTLFTQADWKGAFAAYSALATQFPTHPVSRFRLGVTQMELGNLDEAEASLREGERLGMPPQAAAYRLAQVLVEKNKSDEAAAQLLRAAANGLFVPASALRGDRHLAKLASHEKWPTVLAAFDAIAQPCRHDPRFRQFDFWIGDWDVSPTGAPRTGPQSRNTVTLDDNSCVVTEHWDGLGGSTGRSFNLFDRSIGKWRQTWVDNTGGQHDYRGELKDGNMVYEGDTPAPNGQLGRIPTRLTFFRIGRDSVRQFSQTSSDSGRTWQTAYDLMYVRRPAKATLLLDSGLAALRALDSTFVQGWLKNDTAAVLGVFAPDAVLLPPGHAPVSGVSAIKAYWFPTDGSHTRITSFTRHLDEIDGNGSMAYVRGTATLSWEMVQHGKTTKQTSRSTDLLVVRQDEDGHWRVVQQAWSQMP